MAMNMTNINNDLAAGKDVRIDFKQMQNFGECARRAKQSGAEITLFNIDAEQPSVNILRKLPDKSLLNVCSLLTSAHLNLSSKVRTSHATIVKVLR